MLISRTSRIPLLAVPVVALLQLVTCDIGNIPLIPKGNGWMAQGSINLPSDSSNNQYRASDAFINASCISSKWTIRDGSSSSSASVAVMLVPYTAVTQAYNLYLTFSNLITRALPGTYTASGPTSGSFSVSTDPTIAYAMIFWTTQKGASSTIDVQLNASAVDCGATTSTSQRVAFFQFLGGGGSGYDGVSRYLYPDFSGVSCLAYALAAKPTFTDGANVTNSDFNITNSDFNISQGIKYASYLDQDLLPFDTTRPPLLEVNGLPASFTAGKCSLSYLKKTCFAYIDSLDPERNYTFQSISGQRYGTDAYPGGQLVEVYGSANGSCAQIFPGALADNVTVFKLAASNSPVSPGPVVSPTSPTPPTPPTPSSHMGKGSNVAGIAGGVAGGAVAVALLVFIGFLVMRKRRKHRSTALQNAFANKVAMTDAEYRSGVDPFTKQYQPFGELDLELQPPKKMSTTNTSSTGTQTTTTDSYGTPRVQLVKLSEAQREFGLKGGQHPVLEPTALGRTRTGFELTEDAILPPHGRFDPRLNHAWMIDVDSISCQVVNNEPLVLGEGGFGKVYAGLRNQVQQVAIKAVNSNSTEQQHRFLQEIMLLKACLDPNIVQFLGACIRDRQTMMIMEYMGGGDLYRQLAADNSRAYGWYGRGRKIALDIIKGLCFLHSNNIAHLDLKTPNILLTDSHVAKISDVGLGKLIAGGSIIASQMGSFMWASPEQLQGLECGFSSDMFSFGTILWEICSGEQLRHRGLRRLVTPDECPYAIQDLIDRCHLPEAHRRPTAFEAHAILAR